MMEYLRKLFKSKDKPIKQNIILIGAIGIVLIIVSQTFLKSSSDKKEKDVLNQTKESTKVEEISTYDYEEKIESKLENLLSNVEGVGKVEVMVNISYSSEIVLAEDVSENNITTTETDSQGGKRENINKVTDSKKIIIQSPSGGQEPIILKEIVPKIEGVIIVSEGGENVLVKQALINSAVTVLGVEPHKVQVLKMKVDK